MSRIKPFCEPTAVERRCAQMLHKEPADLPAEWTHLAAQATADAHGDLIQILVGKGYAYAQIALWDDGPAYCERLAAYFAMVRGAALAAYDLKAVEALDPRKMLSDAAYITVGGEPVSPAGLFAGVQYGSIDLDDLQCRADRFFR